MSQSLYTYLTHWQIDTISKLTYNYSFCTILGLDSISALGIW